MHRNLLVCEKNCYLAFWFSDCDELLNIMLKCCDMCVCLVNCDSGSDSISIQCCDMSIGLVNCGNKPVITAMSTSVVALWTWDQLKRRYTHSVT